MVCAKEALHKQCINQWSLMQNFIPWFKIKIADNCFNVIGG